MNMYYMNLRPVWFLQGIYKLHRQLKKEKHM